MDRSALRIVDADGHVLEPLSVWAGLPEGQRPRIAKDARGVDHALVGDREILAGPLALTGIPGARMCDFERMRRTTWDEIYPGGYDPKRRLADMDGEGIDAAVLYPTLGLWFWAVEDPATAVALARAYNDWLASYCEADRTRLYGAAMLPLQDPEAAAQELRRARLELGFKAAFVRPNPCLGRAIVDTGNEIVWSAAEDLGVALAIHEASATTIRTLGEDRPLNALVLHAASHCLEQMLACAQLIAFGVLERHPGLRLAFLESGGGWVAFWLERLDDQVRGFGDYCPQMKLLPSEYFARQCWIGFEAERAIVHAAREIGADRIVWGSDYPHHDCIFPGATEKLLRNIAPLSEVERCWVLSESAEALYRLSA